MSSNASEDYTSWKQTKYRKILIKPFPNETLVEAVCELKKNEK